MKKYQINCPYCGSPAICRPAGSIYGAATWRKGSYLYLCSRWPVCDSYVSAHKKSRLPMGSLADKNLRQKRIQAHQALEKLRREKHMEKWAVYLWLQGKLQMEPELVHIGMFSEETCDQVTALCTKALQATP